MKLFSSILACLVALPLALAALDHDAGLILGSLPNCAVCIRRRLKCDMCLIVYRQSVLSTTFLSQLVDSTTFNARVQMNIYKHKSKNAF